MAKEEQQTTESTTLPNETQAVTLTEPEEKEQQVTKTEENKTGDNNANSNYDSEIWANITPQQNASLEALHQSMQLDENSDNKQEEEREDTYVDTKEHNKSPPQQQQSISMEDKPVVGSEEWHKQRRENHKQVERRRRENINEGINELSRIVPGCEKNKGSILNRAAVYIRQLKETEAATLEKWTLEKLLTDQAINELNRQVEVFKTELERVKLENNYLKRELDSVTNGDNQLLREVKKQKLDHQASLHDD